LHIAKTLVISIQSQKLIVFASLYDFAFVEHADFIGMADG
jgi:hypothetical protein